MSYERWKHQAVLVWRELQWSLSKGLCAAAAVVVGFVIRSSELFLSLFENIEEMLFESKFAHTHPLKKKNYSKQIMWNLFENDKNLPE